MSGVNEDNFDHIELEEDTNRKGSKMLKLVTKNRVTLKKPKKRSCYTVRYWILLLWYRLSLALWLGDKFGLLQRFLSKFQANFNFEPRLSVPYSTRASDSWPARLEYFPRMGQLSVTVRIFFRAYGNTVIKVSWNFQWTLNFLMTHGQIYFHTS